MKRSRHALLGLTAVSALAVSVGFLANQPSNATRAAAPQEPACSYPAQRLDLRNWKVTLPTGGKEKPTEIKQPKLGNFRVDPWFTVNQGCTGVQFRAAVNGVTTSGSGYPRSELREMANGGKDNASWSTTAGTHTLTIDQTITQLPKVKPHLVTGQIHDSEDDVTVFRLEGTRMYVTNGDNSTYKLIEPNYRLGTRFQVRFVVSGGKINAYYNGQLKATLTKKASGSYFKAGAYTQANCQKSKPCASSNYGEVIVHKVTVTHQR